eukprot:7311709-Pyramimonas_sp.AAC.1
MGAALDKLERFCHPRRVASSPAEVVCLTASRIGWRLSSSTRLRDDLGRAWNLCQLSPSGLRGLVLDGAMRASGRLALD